MAETTPTATPIPPLSHNVPLASQVGGHAGVMTNEDGSLLIKPAHPVEVGFYQSVGSESGLAPLRPYIPKFYGILKLEGQVDPSSAPGDELKVIEVKAQDKDRIVLENLSFSFSKPNILDVKLGTVLYDDDASPEKRERMEKAAKATTSFETGVRLTGFQVYDLSTGLAVNTPKSYGRSINASQLSEGISRFFPIATSQSPPQPQGVDAATEQAEKKPTGTGLPPHLLLPILEFLREDIKEIRDVLSEIELRMVGGSLLIIYDADWKRAEEGLKWIEENGDDEDDDEDDEDEDEETRASVGPPYLVKLIDFAHTRIVPGQGPDQGVLKGVDTVLGLLDGRIDQVKAALALLS